MKSEFMLNVHGVGVRVEGPAKIVEWLRHDYGYFEGVASGVKLTVKADVAVPDLSKEPDVSASLYHEDYVAYDSGGIRYVVYFNGAFCVYEPGNSLMTVTASDLSVLYDVLHTALESKLGDLLDGKGLHRVHALAFTVDSFPVVVLLPVGGGKTTLALALLKREGVRLISEDTPLVSRDGRIFAFPSRLGVRNRDEAKSFEGNVRTFQRAGHGEKTLVSAEAFSDKIQKEAGPPYVLILGSRRSKGGLVFSPSGKFAALPRLLKNMILGLELPQALAYFMGLSFRENLSRLPSFWGRGVAALRLLNYSSIYSASFGSDIDQSVDMLIGEVRKKCPRKN
ncbi:Uncharacterised protein [uncultured archaeon]|nr:Uncharacterised protein [uncultured archaeon]